MRSAKIGSLIRKCLSQGISPRKLALTITLGAVIGTIPMLWGATLVCAILAFCLRLNQAGIQAANYLVYPLQLALIVPFYRIGAWLFPWGPVLSADEILSGWRTNAAGNFAVIFLATLKALGAWLLLAPPAAVLLYFTLLPVVTKMALSLTGPGLRFHD